MSNATETIHSSANDSPLMAALARINPLIFVLLALYLLMLIMSDRFLSTFNQMNILRQGSVFLILAVGQTFVIASRGIDLSVGAIVGATGCLAAGLISFGLPTPLAVAVGIAFGMVIGLVNGLVITKLKVNPLIATLGMMVALRGATHYLMSGSSFTRLSDGIQFLGQGVILGVPMPAIIAGTTALVGYWLLFYTRFGRYTTSIGSNESAVGLVGITVDRMKIKVYVLQGACAGLAACVLIGRLNGASPDLGLNYELHVIAAVVLGGTALYGGVGTILGTVLGILTIAVVENSMVLIRADFHLQRVLIGALLIAAVAYQGYRRRQSGASE